MPRQSHHRAGTSLATPLAPMRLAATLALLAVLATPAAASAQSLTITTVTRDGSPRQAETTMPLTPMTPIGLRDCNCEIWTFTGSITGAITFSNPRLEYWIGTDMMSCLTRTNRATSGTTTPSCWEIPEDVVPPVQPIGSNTSFTVRVPAVLLVNPTARSCTAPMAQLQSSGTLYLFAMIRNSPTDDTMPPAVTYPIAYNIVGPTAPSNVVATAQDTSAQITWNSVATSASTTTDDSATTTTTTTATVGLTFFHILCFPSPPPNYDAGATDAAVCDVNVGDAQVAADVFDSGVDVFDAAVDAALDGTFVDVVPTDATSDIVLVDTALVDTALTDGTAFDGVSTDSGLTCDQIGLPAGFDPNNDQQRLRYECSPPVTSMASSTVVQGLLNGGHYKFAVIAEDNAGNMSPPAVTGCVTPVPVTDFWQHYRDAGGRGQVGFCAVRPGPVGLRGGVPIAFGALGLAVWWRRRRRSSRTRTKR